MSEEKAKLYFKAEKEAIFFLLTGIGDEIYSTVDACNTANEMWTSHERIHKQFQKEVNDIRAERIAKSANPLELLAAAQPYSDNYYQALKPLRTNTTSASTRPKDSDPDQDSEGLRICKRIAILESFSRSSTNTPTTTLRIPPPPSSNSRNKTEIPHLGYNNDFNQSGQFGNQRTMIVARARETVGSPVVQQKGIWCFNCKGFGHYAKECRKLSVLKTTPEQADWLEDTDEGDCMNMNWKHILFFMAKIQEVLPEESSSTDQPLEQVQNNDENNVFANERRHSEQPESINDTYVLEKDDSNVTPDSSNICNNDNQVDQNAAECVDERAALANLIANLTLDTEENKTILKQLKKANASLTQELKECRTNLDETGRALGEATSCRDSCLIALQNKQNELEKYIAFNDRTIDYDILQTKLNETLGLLARKDIDIKEGLKTKAYEISVVNQKHDELVKKSLLTKSQFEGQLKEKSKVISDLKVKEGRDIDKMIEMDKTNKVLNENSLQTQSNQFSPFIFTLQNLPQNRKQAEIHSNVLKPGMHRIATSTKQNREPQLPHASRNTNPHVSKSTRVTHPTSVSRPQLKSYQVKDKVVPNISQVKFTKKEVEDHHRISSISKKTKSVTVCTNTTNSRTSNVNAVCAECGKCVFNSNHDACVSRYLNVMNARTKKPNVLVPIEWIVNPREKQQICCNIPKKRVT
ncbi:retrovirus-related pol polyprotein from transposon TNT 1-94 [Tanacetum coccineum]